jgi:hypothetical protein
MPNHDEKTGISYGVISQHNISSESLNDLYVNGTDPHLETAKSALLDDIKELCNNHGLEVDNIDTIQFIDELYNNYEPCGDGQIDYSDKDYTLHVSGDNFGIFVIKSPYYTFCRKCSPCAPGAGDLDNATDVTLEDDGVWESSGEMAYCLGKEFFDDGDEPYSRKIPYRVFRVDNDQEVI